MEARTLPALLCIAWLAGMLVGHAQQLAISPSPATSDTLDYVVENGTDLVWALQLAAADSRSSASILLASCNISTCTSWPTAPVVVPATHTVTISPAPWLNNCVPSVGFCHLRGRCNPLGKS